MNYTQRFLRELFSRLNNSKITYCVLRNYERLPETVGHDVDIWVHSRDEEKFKNILLSIAKDVGWEIVRYAPWLSNRGQGRYFFVQYDDKLHAIHFDCYVSIYCKGFNYADEHILEKSLYLHDKGFYVPSYGVEASILFLKDLLYEGKIKEKYRSRITFCLEKDVEGFLTSLDTLLGKKMASTLLDILKGKNWDKIENKRVIVWKCLIKRAFIKRPFFQIRQLWLYLYSRFKEHFFEDLGIFIVLIGPDGSGKTTISNSILESEGIKKLFQIKSYFHGRFSKIPELKKMIPFVKTKTNKKTINDTGTNTFSSKEASFLKALIYPIYYSLDFFLGHFIIRRVRAYYCIAISDRYFYDYWIQKRYNKCPRWLLALIGKCIPKPDITIYLKNFPEVISSRKKDLPIEEIKRQAKVCEDVIKKFPNGIIIETSNTVETVVKEIEEIILDVVRTKWEKSPGHKYIHAKEADYSLNVKSLKL